MSENIQILELKINIWKCSLLKNSLQLKYRIYKDLMNKFG